MYSVSFCFN